MKMRFMILIFFLTNQSLASKNFVPFKPREWKTLEQLEAEKKDNLYQAGMGKKSLNGVFGSR